VLLWSLPFVATWIAHRISAGEGDVNMFGMTERQHQVTVATLLSSYVVVLVLCWVLRVGYLWLPVTLVVAVAIAFALNLVDEHLVGVPQAVLTASALVVAPAGGALPTRGRARA